MIVDVGLDILYGTLMHLFYRPLNRDSDVKAINPKATAMGKLTSPSEEPLLSTLKGFRIPHRLLQFAKYYAFVRKVRMCELTL